MYEINTGPVINPVGKHYRNSIAAMLINVVTLSEQNVIIMQRILPPFLALSNGNGL